MDSRNSHELYANKNAIEGQEDQQSQLSGNIVRGVQSAISDSCETRTRIEKEKMEKAAREENKGGLDSFYLGDEQFSQLSGNIVKGVQSGISDSCDTRTRLEKEKMEKAAREENKGGLDSFYLDDEQFDLLQDPMFWSDSPTKSDVFAKKGFGTTLPWEICYLLREATKRAKEAYDLFQALNQTGDPHLEEARMEILLAMASLRSASTMVNNTVVRSKTEKMEQPMHKPMKTYFRKKKKTQGAQVQQQ